MTEETTKKAITLKDIFGGLVKINKRLDARDIRLEAIREGISHNASRFDRMDANIHNLRAEVLIMRADLRDMGEKPRNQDMSIT